MMFLLNKQVELAEGLENCWVDGANPNNNNPGSSENGGADGGVQTAKYFKMKRALNDFLVLETKCSKEFKTRLDALS